MNDKSVKWEQGLDQIKINTVKPIFTITVGLAIQVPIRDESGDYILLKDFVIYDHQPFETDAGILDGVNRVLANLVKALEREDPFDSILVIPEAFYYQVYGSKETLYISSDTAPETVKGVVDGVVVDTIKLKEDFLFKDALLVYICAQMYALGVEPGQWIKVE